MSSTGINLNTATSGTGIDVTSVVDNILYAERAPERLMQQQVTNLQTQASLLTSLNSGLSTLSDKVNALKDSFGALNSKSAISSQASILSATAQSTAASANHIVVVSRLASTGTAYSDAQNSSTATFQTGTISLTVGGASKDLQVTSDNNTLDGLAAAINQQGIGVTASVVTDASGARLALVSTATGNAGDLTIMGNTSGLVMHKGASGQNASLTIDGVPISSATNTVTGAIAGVTLNLASAAPQTEVQLNVGPDQSGASQAVQDFVTAYNSVISAINAQFAVNPSTHNQGPLASNSSLRALQTGILSDVTFKVEDNSSFVNLATLGVKMADDGTLSIDQTKLNSAITSNYADFQSFFQSDSSGFAVHFGADLQPLTDSTDGLLNVNLAQNTAQQKSLSTQIADFEDRIAVRQQQLILQYSRVDTMLRQYPLIMSQLGSQLDSLSSLKT
ncbi:MAG TPA: flagellar filament capping protein FliD [Terriglobales bacterium]|jgi:flagellar hook-associated protein 2